jgi:glucokinase
MHLDAEGLLAVVVELAERARGEGAETPVWLGIGCGGPMIFPEGIVSPLHLPAWRDFPLRERLQAALGLPAVLDDDAKSFALDEALFGAGRGARCLLGMVVSTGVGGGVGCRPPAPEPPHAGRPRGAAPTGRTRGPTRHERELLGSW